MSPPSNSFRSRSATRTGRSDFYVEVLGFELVNDVPRWDPACGGCRCARRVAATSITLVTWFDSMAPGAVKGTVLETDDLEGDVARLRTLGVDIPGDIEAAPWGRFVTFDDPDGNGLVLQETTGA